MREGREEKEKRKKEEEKGKVREEGRKERHEAGKRIAGNPATEDGIEQRGEDAPKRGAADEIRKLQWIPCKRCYGIADFPEALPGNEAERT